MRRIGWILSGILGVLVVAVVGAVFAVPAIVDKAFIEKQAESATGRKLAIGGKFALNLVSMSPSVAMENVTFANAAWGSRPEMVKIKKFEAEVQLMPLLSGGVEVNRLLLDGLDFIGERKADGSANWEFAPKDAAPPQKPDKPAAAQAPGEVTIPLVKDLAIRNVNVLFKDAQAKTELTAVLDVLELKAPDVTSPMTLKMRGSYNKIPFEADGTLGSVNQLMGKGGAYPLTIAAKAVGAVFNAKGEIKNLQEAEGINIQVSLSGDKLESTVAAAKPLVAQLADLTIPEIGPYKVAALVQGSPKAMKLSAIDVRIGKPEQLLVTVGGEVGNALQGKNLNVKFEVKAPNVAPIIKALKIEMPPVPAIEVAGVAKDPDGWIAVENLAVKIADSDLAGRVAAKLDSKRPSVTADLTANLINIDQLQPKDTKKPSAAPAQAAKPAAKPAAPSQRVFPDDPLPFDLLKTADADVKFKAKKIIANGLPVEDVAVDLKLVGGKLDIKPLQATVSGGKITANTQLDASAAMPTLGVKLDVAQLDFGKMLDHLDQKGLAKGKLDVQTDITSKGGSVRAIMANLNGFTNLTTKDGEIDNRLVQILTADIQNIVPMFQKDEHKQIKCGVIRFDYVTGLANAKTFLFETGGLSIVGTGNINLGDEALKLAFDPKAKNKSAVNLAIPFTVGGTLASPSPGVSAEYVAKKAGKVALGVMTGGMSTLAEMAYDATSSVDQTDYCALALAGKPLVADESKVTKSDKEPAAQPGQATTPATKPEGGVGGAVQGLGRALGGALGR